jgi:hypothetical protein
MNLLKNVILAVRGLSFRWLKLSKIVAQIQNEMTLGERS